MKIIERSLAGRAFAIQFEQIMLEFGSCIPWLEPLKPLSFSTNGKYVRDRILQSFRCRDPFDITSLQFVTPDCSGEYIAGMMLFRYSPERFIDAGNQAISKELASSGYSFLSCLQVRNDLRNQGYGAGFVGKVFRTLVQTHGKVQWVVANRRSINTYISMGATLQSPLVNQDGVWLMSYNRKTAASPSHLFNTK